MKIKNQEELANVLGMAFRTFSATIATGRGIEEFSRLMEEGRNSIVADITLLADGSIVITDAFPKPKVTPEPEPEPVMPIVESPVLEAKRDILAESDQLIAETFAPNETEEVEEKPKRKRKA